MFTITVATLLRADGDVVEVCPKDGETFSLEEMQTLVGETVELHSLVNGMALVMDEEGGFKDLPLNRRASALFGREVVGDCLYCPLGMIE